MHHAGLLPIVKEVVEMLFCRGLVKVKCFAHRRIVSLPLVWLDACYARIGSMADLVYQLCTLVSYREISSNSKDIK